MTTTQNVIHAFTTTDPERAALWFSTCLAVDRGYTSRIERVRGAVLVIASDGRAVRFTKGGR